MPASRAASAPVLISFEPDTAAAMPSASAVEGSGTPSFAATDLTKPEQLSALGTPLRKDSS